MRKMNEILKKLESKKRVISKKFPILRSYLDFELNIIGKNNYFQMFVLTKK